MSVVVFFGWKEWSKNDLEDLVLQENRIRYESVLSKRLQSIPPGMKAGVNGEVIFKEILEEF